MVQHTYSAIGEDCGAIGDRPAVYWSWAQSCCGVGWPQQKRKRVSIMAMGRPTVMTPEIVGKIEYGFMKGLNVTECCHYADISRQAFYDYLEKNPDFSDRIEELKSNPSTRAKLNVVEAIENGDTDLSKWWLERRNKDEFSLKQEVSADVNSNVTINVELIDE
jgi:hypothetical protein